MTPNRSGWEKMYVGLKSDSATPEPSYNQQTEILISQHQTENDLTNQTDTQSFNQKMFQVQNRYIVSNVKSGLMIIDQQKAYERIFFERLKTSVENKQPDGQRLLFPEKLEVSQGDALILTEWLESLTELGIELSDFGNGTFVINSLPAGVSRENAKSFIELLLEDVKKDKSGTIDERRIRLLHLVAGNLANRSLKILKSEEMQQIVDELFASSLPDIAPDGSKILKIIPLSEIDKLIR
jgi:DNA mismatch repair protein MutL